MDVEFGLGTFGDMSTALDGTPLSGAQTIRNVVAQAELADQLGVDYFAVGEHHRPEFAISAPEMVLATIAGRTENIKLGTAVTVLSSDDPVRVYERFATLDAVSNGRAEPVLGRGSFTESFPLFGYDLRDYEALFEQKLDLFAELVKEKPVTWSGTMRPALENADVFPKTENGLRPWVGVGGSPESIIRVARYGFGLTLAIIGGAAFRFKPLVDLYHRAVDQFGTELRPISAHSPGHIADTDDEAWEQAYPGMAAMNSTIGRERGWPAYSRAQFQNDVGPMGAMYAGSPDRVATKMAETIRALGLGRFELKYASGTTPHEHLMRSIELYATEVVPRVRRLLADD